MDKYSESVLNEFLVLQNEVHDLRQNASVNTGSPHHKMYGDSYGAEGLQEMFNPVQSFHGAPLTGRCCAWVHFIQGVGHSIWMLS